MRALAFLLLVLAPGALAQDVAPRGRAALLPGIGAADPRHPADIEALPWRALGRVQTELGGRCTGALIGPRTVLTAAHCLVAPRTRNFVRPESIHVLVGYRLGVWALGARVTAFTTGRFRPGQGPATADWALLTLARPIGTPDRILPLLRQIPPAGTAVMLGGWQQDRPEVLLADTGCRLIGNNALLLHDCAGTRGASGAPLLARGADGNWAILGVQVAAETAAAIGVALPVATLPLP